MAKAKKRVFTEEDKYPILATLKRFGRPITRENYLAIAGWDNPNPEMTQEDEMDMPPQLRK